MGDIYRKKDGNWGVRTSSGIMKLGKRGTLEARPGMTRLPEWKFNEHDRKLKYDRKPGEKRGTKQGDDLYGRRHHNGVANTSGIRGAKV